MLKIQKSICFKELDDFITYCEIVRKFSESTLYNYFRDLIMFFRYMKFIKGNYGMSHSLENISIEDIDTDFLETIDTDDIYRYFDYLTIYRKNSQRTCQRRFVAIKMFFRYAYLTAGVIERDPAEELEMSGNRKKTLKFMDEQDCITLLNSIDGKDSERDYCILVIFINCGIRFNEIVHLDNNDINSDGTVIIKGRKGILRTIHFNQACMDALDKYRKFNEEFFESRCSDHNAVFVGKNGKRLTGRWIEQIVRKRMNEAGFGDRILCPNRLRHTSAIIMYQQGVDTGVVKDIIGYKGLSATQVCIKKQNK
ncbi:MAG: tyrosine-type recombinase/integrase [Ruminococcus sp.]|nr:tyrosine-type recombinase/integrase [Ruminococcus sp.]